MATHSSVLAWEIPWTEEPSGLQSWDPKESDTIERLTISLSMPKYLLHQNDGTDFRILTGLQMWYMVSYLC